MANFIYDKEVLECFLKNQGQLFDEPVAETLEEADEFLEHSRVFYFENGGNYEVYCASADWMPRNLERRVEILYPIDDDGLKESLIHILDVLLADNMRASIMDKDGTYDKPDRRGKQSVCAHDVFKEEAAVNVTVEKNYKDERIFIPRERIMVD